MPFEDDSGEAPILRFPKGEVESTKLSQELKVQ